MRKRFERWKNELKSLPELEIPRCLLTHIPQEPDLVLPVLCDASKLAFATRIFFKCQTDKGTICQLIQARTRLALLKQIYIPLLELLACSTEARLVSAVKIDFQLESEPMTYWTGQIL
ncbi:uncharacterized protein NPIL_551231 [Nephila pilipes]|uniref:Uncharacterized protein n=1 Tax=Nephila pilipes TaxID=299642 RepID=A0A8X6M7B5_NEPPI|nr:uncharacterized protein NPIL_551231 [Nephila pilipes]